MFQKTGLLYYLGWKNRPWKMFTEKEEIDIYPLIDAFFKAINGKRANQEQDIDGYLFLCDEDSDKIVQYVPEKK